MESYFGENYWYCKYFKKKNHTLQSDGIYWRIFLKETCYVWHKVRVDTKGGHMIWEEGEGHFFTVLFFCWIFLTYSYFSMFMKDNTICSEEQLYHKAISYFTSIETVATCFDQLIAEMKTFCKVVFFFHSCFFFSFFFWVILV